MTAKPIGQRLNRRLKSGQNQVENLSQQAGATFEAHVVNRLTRLGRVRRFVGAWLGLMVLLITAVAVQTVALDTYFQHLQPVPGGIYTEGILGDFSNANPLYATSPVNAAVARLVFAGLFKYNTQNRLVGDLAANWQVSANGQVYKIYLKPDLFWQDGQPLTAADVVFTYQTIENPLAQSPLALSFQNVKVAALNSLTVTFTLPNPLSSFIYSLTNGILPKHLLAQVPVDQLRETSFNLNPIGAGPFRWKNLAVEGTTPQTRQEQITLTAFDRYNGGAPKLAGFVIRAFHDQAALISTFQKGDLTGAAGLTDVPQGLKHQSGIHVYDMPLTAANMVFFKTDNGVLSDVNVRQALIKAANVNKIILGLSYPAIPVSEPFLKNQFSFNPAYEQASYNRLAAANQLSADGWVPGPDGIRIKNSQPLSFMLYTPNDSEDMYVARSLIADWKAVGVDARLVAQNTSDLDNTLTFHTYDALLYGISIGVDPDVFVYWDSSQASPSSATRLNFSEWSNATADASLMDGRTRSNPAERIVKYQPFLKAWQQDAPALGLYQPRFLYLTTVPVYGLSDQTINQAPGRYDNVVNWEINTAKVTD